MNLKTEVKENVLVITLLEQRLDAKFAVDFRNRVNEFSQENSNIILDFSNTNFIDSSGLGAVVSVLKVIGRNGKLALSNIKDTVMQTFTRTRMDKIFAIYKTNEEAVNSFL